MNGKLMFPIEDKENKPFCRLKLLVENMNQTIDKVSKVFKPTKKRKFFTILISSQITSSSLIKPFMDLNH